MELTEVINHGYDLVLGEALVRKDISEEVYNKLIKRRIVATDRKNFFSTIVDFLRSKTDVLRLCVVSVEKAESDS